jgi:1-acyl-sn-glycerol-3-phosphate acyltransferase
MKSLWYYGCHWLCARIYFERTTVLHPERLPEDGPTLYVCLHRNGAVDGFVYRQVLPRGIYLVSTQLLRSFFARLFFCGIAVARTKDEDDHGQNEAAMCQCTKVLAEGGVLVVFPEGTSALGPRHLPFKSGAMSIALEALARGVPLRIIPVGIKECRCSQPGRGSPTHRCSSCSAPLCWRVPWSISRRCSRGGWPRASVRTVPTSLRSGGYSSGCQRW